MCSSTLAFTTAVAPKLFYHGPFLTWETSLSLSDFYERVIRHDHDCQPEGHELNEARVGRSKESLDSVSDLGEDSFNYFNCRY